MSTRDEKEAGQLVAFAKYGARVLVAVLVLSPVVGYPAKLWLDANYETKADAKTTREIIERVDRNTARWCERTSTDPRKDCQ